MNPIDPIETIGVKEFNLDTIPDTITHEKVFSLDEIPDTLDDHFVETDIDTGPTQSEIDLEKQKLKIEQDKLLFEKQKLAQEQR